jgi:hypothetical protein
MRIAASVAQLLQVRWEPRGARTGSWLMSPSWRDANEGDKQESVIAWAWQTHAANQVKFQAAMADPANSHLRFVRLENPGAARKFLRSAEPARTSGVDQL